MKYIVNKGNITYEYNVKLNVEALDVIRRELETKCYRIINKETKVYANNEQEAIEKINPSDRSGIRVKKLTDDFSAMINKDGKVEKVDS